MFVDTCVSVFLSQVLPWVSPVPTFPNRPPTWSCSTITSRQSLPVSRKVALSLTISRSPLPTPSRPTFPRSRPSSSSCAPLCPSPSELSPFCALIWELTWWVFENWFLYSDYWSFRLGKIIKFSDNISPCHWSGNWHGEFFQTDFLIFFNSDLRFSNYWIQIFYNSVFQYLKYCFQTFFCWNEYRLFFFQNFWVILDMKYNCIIEYFI